MITRRGLLHRMDTAVAEGVFVDAAGVAHASATTRPFGVVVISDFPAGWSTVALAGDPEEVQLKCHSTVGSVVKGTRLQMHTNGTVKADLATGGRVIVAEALEPAVNSQLVRARLLSNFEVLS